MAWRSNCLRSQRWPRFFRHEIGPAFTIPANTTATVLVPAKSAGAITESGKPLAKAPGVKFLRMEGDRAVLEVEAGSYRFASGMGQLH